MPKAKGVVREDSDALQIMKYFTDSQPHESSEIAERMYWVNGGVIVKYIVTCVQHGLLVPVTLDDSGRKGYKATAVGKTYYLWSPLKEPMERRPMERD